MEMIVVVFAKLLEQMMNRMVLELIWMVYGKMIRNEKEGLIRWMSLVLIVKVLVQKIGEK